MLSSIENVSIGVLGRLATTFILKQKITATDVYKSQHLTYSYTLSLLNLLKKLNLITQEEKNGRCRYYHMTEKGKKIFLELYDIYLVIKNAEENISTEQSQS